MISEILLSARQEIWPEMLTDTFFTKTPTLARMREKTQLFDGGSFLSNLFRHTPMIASSYAPGSTHTITKRQTTDEQQLQMKLYQVSIPEFLEELLIFNAAGSNQVFSLLDEDLSNGLDTIETYILNSFWGGGTTDPTRITGFDEYMGHATAPSWNNVVASTINGVSRSTYANQNSNLFWYGTQAGGTAPISFKKLNHFYTKCIRGMQELDTLVMNKSLYASIEEKMQAQQIVDSSVIDPYWGGTGFKFKKCLIVRDEYCPSLEDGKTDAQNGGLGNYLTSTATSPSVAVNNFPGSAITLTVGEVIFGLNMNYWAFRLAKDPQYQFGLTDFKEVPDSEKVVARIKASAQLQNFAGSQYQGQAYGFSV